MKQYEFKWRDAVKPELLVGADASAALNHAGYTGENWRDFDWYREIIPPTMGYVPILLGNTRRGQPVWDTLKFYAVAVFTQNNFHAVLIDWMMERQWMKVEDPGELKFQPGFSLEKDLVTIDEPVSVD